MKDIAGKVGVVTGGAAGIGKALALELARGGMDVALADLDEAGMRQVAGEIEALGRRAICVPTDVRQAAAVETLLQRTLAELGSCALMVNNAGVFCAAPLLDTSAEQYQRVIDINVGGVVHGCRVFGAHFAQQGFGHIVNTASAAGLFPTPGMSAYSLTKFGIVGYSLQLRWELAARGVGVTVLCPGSVKTDILLREGVGVRPDEVEKLMRGAPGTEKLARKAVRAVRRNRPMVLYAPDAYAMYVLRLLPMWLLDPLGRLIGRTALNVVKTATALPGGTEDAAPNAAEPPHSDRLKRESV